MKNSLFIFKNSLTHAKSDEIDDILEDLTFNLSRKEIENNYSEKEKILNYLLIHFTDILEELQLLNHHNMTQIIHALIKASIQEKQNTLHSLIKEKEQLENKIEFQKSLIKNQISNIFFDFEKTILDSNHKDIIHLSLNDAILFDIEMLGILKETAESAFLTTLEKAEDIELTSAEIAKNLTYNAICEADFAKERILKISNIILTTAFEISNASLIYSKDLCLGSIKGTQEGIGLAIEKFKSSLKYLHQEDEIKTKSKELIGIEDDFITLLKSECKKQNNPSKEIIENLLTHELDNIFSKFKRLASESREQIALNLNELKKNPKIHDLNKLTQEKLSLFKKEIIELEKLAAEKYKDFNTKKAKKLGVLLWEKSKKFLKK